MFLEGDFVVEKEIELVGVHVVVVVGAVVGVVVVNSGGGGVCGASSYKMKYNINPLLVRFVDT